MDNENEMLEAAAPEDDEVMLPDGYQEDEDIFGEKENADDPDEEQEDPEADVQESAEDSENEPEKKDSAPAEGNFKFMSGNVEITVKESDIQSLYLRAQERDNFNGQLQSLRQTMSRIDNDARALGFQNAQEMLGKAVENFRAAEVNRLVGEGMHEEAAKDLVERKMQRVAPQAVQQSAPARNYREEFGEFMQHYPQLRESLKNGGKLPEEVTTAWLKNNVPLRVAYAEYETKEVKAEAERVKKENEILQQNAENAKKAPVKGVSGSAAPQKSKDSFLAGFEFDY